METNLILLINPIDSYLRTRNKLQYNLRKKIKLTSNLNLKSKPPDQSHSSNVITYTANQQSTKSGCTLKKGCACVENDGQRQGIPINFDASV